MRANDFLPIINEKILKSEFAFGFELEAITNRDIGLRGIKRILDSLYGAAGDIGVDASIEVEGDVEAFEWRSPPLPFTPKNIIRLKDFLLAIEEEGFYTNQSCGFHVHFSAPLQEADYAFLIFALARDDEMIATLTRLNDISFENSQQANPEFLHDIRNAENVDATMRFINQDKRRLLRLHPQGTLEWRGPRDFLHDREAIASFVALLGRFVGWMQDILARRLPVEMPNYTITYADVVSLLADRKKVFHPAAIDSILKQLPGKPTLINNPILHASEQAIQYVIDHLRSSIHTLAPYADSRGMELLARRYVAASHPTASDTTAIIQALFDGRLAGENWIWDKIIDAVQQRLTDGGWGRDHLDIQMLQRFVDERDASDIIRQYPVLAVLDRNQLMPDAITSHEWAFRS